MKILRPRAQQGFSLLELMISCAVLLIVLGSVFRYIAIATQRSQAEATKMDLTQQAREFVDEFERDLHQAGYPNCRIFNTGSNCIGHFTDANIAAGLVFVSNTAVGFEGDMDGDGVVDEVWYRLVDSAGNYPPTGTCPCTIQRSQMPKVAGVSPWLQGVSPYTSYSQELQNVINSGVPTSGVYGNGLPIAGNTAWGTSNTSFYAAMTTVKDYPVFSAYDQNGMPVTTLPLDISTPTGVQNMSLIKSVRLTINLLANANNGYDMQTHVRPVMTLVGTGRVSNCYILPCD